MHIIQVIKKNIVPELLFLPHQWPMVVYDYQAHKYFNYKLKCLSKRYILWGAPNKIFTEKVKRCDKILKSVLRYVLFYKHSEDCTCLLSVIKYVWIIVIRVFFLNF